MGAKRATQTADDVAACCHTQLNDVMNCLYFLADQYPDNPCFQAAHATGQRLMAYLLAGVIQLDRERDMPDVIHVGGAGRPADRVDHGAPGHLTQRHLFADGP